MNTNTLSVSLAVLALSGLLLSAPASARTECQKQQLNQRAFMASASIKLEACVSEPGPICLEAINDVDALNERWEIDHALMRSCFSELAETDRAKSRSQVDETLEFTILLGKVTRILDRASKTGNF